MSFWSSLTGQDAADASRNAAADTYYKQKNAIGDLTRYGDEYAGKFSDLAKGYDPYVQTGYTANNSLQALLANPNAVSSLPGYQFTLNQGLNAVDRGAAARSGVQNGATIKAEQRYGAGLADQTYGNQLARLLSASHFGTGALGQQNATVGQGLQGQLATRQAGFNGQMQSANTIGLGDIAAANAQAAGSQNLLNAGLKIAGMAAGGFGGMPFGGGGSSFAGGGGMGIPIGATRIAGPGDPGFTGWGG